MNNEEVKALNPDWGKTAADYAAYRAGLPPSFFARLETMGVLRVPMRAVDLGTGTGNVARELAIRGLDVTAVDLSAPMLAQAQAMDRNAGLSVRYVNAAANDTGLESESFDLVTASTCWHWFNRPAAARESRRLLVRDGHLVIAEMDFVRIPGGPIAALDRLMCDFHHISNEVLAKLRRRATFNWPFWLDDLVQAGFRGFEAFSYELEVPYSHEALRARIRASAGVGASLNSDQIEAFEREFGAILEKNFQPDPLILPHRVFAAVGVART